MNKRVINEASFRQMISSVRAHIYQIELTEGGNWLDRYLSPNIETLTGHPHEKFVADSSLWPSLVHPEDKPTVATHLKQLSQGRDSEVEYRLVRADGEIIWVSDSTRVETDAGQQTLIAYGIVADITERVRSRDVLAKRAAELQAVAEVSTATATILESDTLLQKVVDLTKESFNLYHAHIYLLDTSASEGEPPAETLKLVVGAGEVGRQMVAEGWRIPLEKTQSLVAQAARSREGVVVNDVLAESGFLPNRLLPDTRSEMAVPLIVGEQVLGVLDVQSDFVNQFTDEDIRVYKTLAAQIAVALQNAQRYEQATRAGFLLGKRVKELNFLDALGREMEASPALSGLLYWVAERLPQAMQHPALCQTTVVFDGEQYGSVEATTLPARISHDLTVQGQAVGSLTVAYTEKREFLDEERAILSAITTRLSGFIENQRLFEETQAALIEVQQSQKLLKSIIDATSDWIFIKDENHRYQLVNRSYAEAMKISPEEFIGKDDLEIGFPEDIVKGNPEKGIRGFWPDDQEVMESGQTKIIDVEPSEIHGRSVYLNTVKVPLLNDEGNIWGVLGYVRDITEQEQLLIQVGRRAERETAIREITDKMRAATSVEELVKTAAIELGQKLSAGHAVLDLGLEQGQDQQPDGNYLN